MTGSNGSRIGRELPAGPSAFVPGTTAAVSVWLFAEAVSRLRRVDERWVATHVVAGGPFARVGVNVTGVLVDGAHRWAPHWSCGSESGRRQTEAELIAAALEANRRQVKPRSGAERKAPP